MSKYRQILQKYWGYDKFRELQEEIILSVAAGKDTLGLLPTGGGKSIIFQVFSLAHPGVCIVITPLIALMKDQVQNLHKRGIKAAAIYTGMSKIEIERHLNNVCYGDYKFLYLSPERLQNEFFRSKLKEMNVNLICVDESHCISQWGYDFRPSYLNIAEIRNELPGVPVLALTATATPEVVDDIQDKLLFKEKNVFKKSFERKNLTYFVSHTEDKLKSLLKIVTKFQGSGVVYVRNRRKTREYALLLKKYKISADFYHAGLDPKDRELKQDAWQKGEIRVMVCTNAFGMGIDKPDVRFVVHMDLPDSLEAYFQEAGRAGRDGKEAWAFLLTNKTDSAQLKRNMTTAFPEYPVVTKVYNSICNYLQIPFGAGKDLDYPFDIFDFASKFKIDVLTTYNSLKILELSELISYHTDVNTTSRIMFIVNRDDLYKFQVENHSLDIFIKLLLRTYTGLFNDYVNISEEYLAKKAGVEPNTIYNLLKQLSHFKIINYIPKINKPLIHFISERLEERGIVYKREELNTLKERTLSRMEAMLLYAESKNKCRSQQLLAYFGQKDSQRCGTCDVCSRRNELGLSAYEFDIILEQIKKIIKIEPILLNDLVDRIDFDETKIIKVVQWLFDNKKLIYNNENKLFWNKTDEANKT
ncbi:MAG TPA: ATP-dependent DNA helicase RecQ [Bacteroidales bacterium]|jgi:ATP-dependent DNA helicase RecQ|nr:ATP-dependent DNA helicase RecQ [Bacteroidales bacterium]HOL98788.1 ATP-dependent DNA helicase RecQ [Bacteroidales bacterium]HPD24526.1 ATP-dependent DNA helicase RecQ [Bacteroidales bacterium]HRT00223.1 ATP-dependent DNA helicase RecQ [Bacteroidales bacterium]HUM33180.1 ATP-dependent DNA helicase RecQ [Bacteroidales bacterium]